jgi:hypothetical protein
MGCHRDVFGDSHQGVVLDIVDAGESVPKEREDAFEGDIAGESVIGEKACGSDMEIAGDGVVVVKGEVVARDIVSVVEIVVQRVDDVSGDGEMRGESNRDRGNAADSGYEIAQHIHLDRRVGITGCQDNVIRHS